MNKPIPEGYWENASGAFVPEANVKEIDKLRDQTVRKLHEKAKEIHELLKDFKIEGFADIASFIQISTDQYGAKVGGNKGNVTLMTYDGRLKIQRNIAENISFDERLQAAKQLIDECLEEWTEGSRDEIKVIINNAFNVDKKGDISTTKVLGLKRIEINHPKWKQAMQAISDSINIIGSKAYLRFYTRDDATGGYLPLSLDIASIS
ncbi:DUF3164 family protein [Acinetobacter baumannii]|uniref:DUF3164 family protein n=2 Tax=Moraxellaceae TaxID=468 RepID=UPI00144AAF73|nr:DUF3164 family protein [Acinetobacter baumannii]NLP54460.1 DUF3164 family protein [Acinetobacter baumannii]NQE75053.1 hypothetical protein [Acinetobacter baumannii]QNT89765.1 DUF3164 family protein [Acinetobacter baumannii]WEX32538.1 DUF3164 family protein [Acinetobacter baumannii]WEX35909.1 DUF3164 family protein [Acinetobacter baumannii]